MSVEISKSEFIRNHMKLSVPDLIAKAAEAGLEIKPGLIYGLRSKAKLDAAGATSTAPVIQPGKKAKKKVAKKKVAKLAAAPVVKPSKKAKKKAARKIAPRMAQKHASLSNGKTQGSAPVAIVFFDTAALVNSMKENFPQLAQGR
jgi:hypothetical protein